MRCLQASRATQGTASTTYEHSNFVGGLDHSALKITDDSEGGFSSVMCLLRCSMPCGQSRILIQFSLNALPTGTLCTELAHAYRLVSKHQIIKKHIMPRYKYVPRILVPVSSRGGYNRRDAGIKLLTQSYAGVAWAPLGGTQA